MPTPFAIGLIAFTARADDVEKLYDAEFVRMWKYYLVACEQTFRFRRQGVFQLQITKEIGALPVTRDYLYSAEKHVDAMAAE